MTMSKLVYFLLSVDKTCSVGSFLGFPKRLSTEDYKEELIHIALRLAAPNGLRGMTYRQATLEERRHP